MVGLFILQSRIAVENRSAKGYVKSFFFKQLLVNHINKLNLGTASATTSLNANQSAATS